MWWYFFSSRRRHTRSLCDWSSDVCSSDLSPYYSLYGHLGEISVNVGQLVNRGGRIARMGYTGEGLNQARAHLHLELNLMLNRNFESWHDQFFRDPNYND